MADSPRQSHVAAILAADAVGYSRAMSRDEALALRALDASTALIRAAVATGEGRVFATAGDAVLAEFATARAALDAAIAMQAALAAAGSEVLSYRIGLHLGPVHPRGRDLLGDAVNIAARLESLAWPGGICLSGQMLEALEAPPPLEVIELGQRPLKNIDGAVRVVRLALGAPEEAEQEQTRATRVAVLPFAAPPDLAYLAEGLADDLVGGLSRFQSLAVLGHAATTAGSDPRRLSADLGVAYALRGSLRGAPDRLRVALDLFEPATGRTVWADRFDAKAGELPAMQDRIVGRLVATLAGRIDAARIAEARRKRPDSAAAFDLVLQGIHHANRLDRGANEAALERFEAAVARDPGYGLAWAWLALMRLRRWAWTPEAPPPPEVEEASARALSLDPSESWCHLVAGQVAMYAGDLETAEVHHKKALALNPYDCHVMALRSPLATYLGKPEEGVDWATRAITLHPGHPSWYATNLGLAHYGAGDYGLAVQSYASVPEPQAGVLAGLAAARAQAGDLAGAAEAAAATLRREPRFSSALFVRMRPYRHERDRAHLLEGLRRAGLPE